MPYTDVRNLTMLRCPDCYGSFDYGWHCSQCGRAYPSTFNIPDLRWPAIADSEETRLIVTDLIDAYERLSFDELCRLRITRLVKVEELEQHYMQYRINNLERGAKMARMFQHRLATYYVLPRHETALDIGCGSGAAAIALSGEFSTVVGIDWYLADLILFRKRLEELKISNVSLTQANLLRQPVADNTFDYATALNVIEHMLDVKRGFDEIARTLRPGGCFCGDSRNRFDILFPEPHVKLRFVGFLPRQWAKTYVARRRGLPYENTRLLSYWELRRTLATRFGDYHIAYPGIDAYRSSTRATKLIGFFETKFKPLARLMLPFFTTMVAIGRKR